MFRPLLCAVLAACLLSAPAAGAPLAEKYLKEGKLADGEKALTKKLVEVPADDQVRFGLGVIQFLRSFERVGASLHNHGLRTSSNFGLLPPPVRKLFPQKEKPAKLSYDGMRKILETFVSDLGRAEKTLATIKDDKVKLPLHVGAIKLDLFGTGKPISAAVLLNTAEMEEMSKAATAFVIGFDRGDVHWLRGYCHMLSAFAEIALAIDGKELFETTAHRFFANVDTPHKFLLEEDSKIAFDRVDPILITDVIVFIHRMLSLPVKDKTRAKSALGHLQATVVQGKEMWKHILAETDDDNEWIPNPKQKGVLQIAVSKDMVDNWQATLNEVEQILEGKRLIPFWRGKKGAMGLNLRKVFLDPPARLDFPGWAQGTAATPYLEKGTITNLADPQTITRLDRTFGGARFFAFAFWFN